MRRNKSQIDFNKRLISNIISMNVDLDSHRKKANLSSATVIVKSCYFCKPGVTKTTAKIQDGELCNNSLTV